MNTLKAIEIINNNYLGNDGSLTCSLYNDSYFSIKKFWEYYDSIVQLVNVFFYNDDMTVKISLSYQRILKEIIYHFSPQDISVIKNFPEDYNSYIERLDFAVLAYYTRNPEMLNDDGFELQRPNSDLYE